MESNYNLIVTIVNKGWADEIVEASKNAGAEGGTIIYGRGTGIHEQRNFFGIVIEPEKEIVLTVVEKNKSKKVLDSIQTAGKLDQPGTGIAFVLDLQEVAGIVHKSK
ncbi:MAG TPA: P-II family nitrogen regulator [Firmicutes bacterium]|nr:P-II family nitrogen regulator [Bacillota bacterium]